ncbi:MAG: hypothetical protein IPL01_07990 [Acidobacteria bacterium]|nr:hypothetical protein [Acidobacteriota bacterium]
MKRKVSEFSYGFVLTHELVNSCGFLPTDLPRTASGSGPGKSSGETESDAHPHGFPIFLQFKASEFMKRKNAGESKLVGLPYFRFTLHRKTQSNMHQLLIELEKRGNAVFYATPRIHETVNLNSAFFDKQIVASSLFVSPSGIGELPDNDAHRVVFSSSGEEVYLCPAPRRLKSVIHGGSFTEALDEVIASHESEELSDDFYHRLAAEMVSIVSPNRRIFDELSRGKLEMNAATFANYLAKTLFDCELLIIPQPEPKVLADESGPQ